MKSIRPPSWLGKVARKRFRELLEQLPSIKPEQTDTLALLSNAWENYLTAQGNIDKHGPVITSGERLFVNPACNTLEIERKAILRLSKVLGLMETTSNEDRDESPFHALLDDEVEKR